VDLAKDFEISKFSRSLPSNTLENIYSLNQENTPEVGSIRSLESFALLLDRSSINLLISYKKQVIGFVICFRENLEYESLNYKFFNGSKQKFLYIDRVVIKSDYRRMGFGTRVYKFLDEIAAKESLPICCEVNSIPLNQISLNFHAKNGFIKVGEKEFKNHSVDYLEK
jgi:predicted GNAT superfamily acetyltransferase